MEIGEVIGWRAWRVVEDEDGARLASVLYEDRWPIDRPLEARCEHEHRAPAYECTCGIYAAKERRLALPYRVGRNDARTLGRVLGMVVLGGDVVEHRDGWRASHARPLRIWAPPRLAATLTGFPATFDAALSEPAPARPRSRRRGQLLESSSRQSARQKSTAPRGEP
jgi:hypothetical protein